MILGIGETLRLAAARPTRAERIDFLRKHDIGGLRAALLLVYDKGLVWDLPKGWTPSFKPCPYLDQENVLHQQMRTFRKFMVDGYPGLSQERKVILLTQLLESIPKDDVDFLLAAMSKRMAFAGINKSLIRDAFPGLIEEDEKEKSPAELQREN